MSAITEINSRHLQNNSIDPNIYWTSTKIKRAVLTLFALLAAGGAVATFLLAPAPFHLAFIGGVALALILVTIAIALLDYDNGKVKQAIRREMQGKDFTEAAGGHNIDRLIKHKVITEEFGIFLKGLVQQEAAYRKEWKKTKDTRAFIAKVNVLEAQYTKFIRAV